MRRRLTTLTCALAFFVASQAVLADEKQRETSPPLHAGDALGLAVFGDGQAAYARARAADPKVAATEKPAPPAKIAPEE